MKLKVVCTRDSWIEADTIGKLKAEIMYHFLLTEGELSQRLLVRDNRDLIRNSYPITGCVDLLQMPDDSTLDGDGLCEDGDTLVLGWKRPCIIRLVTDYALEEGHNIKVDHSFTLGQLKRKIKRLTGEPVTEENLPQVFFNEDDDGKPLLYFGYYSFWKKRTRPDFEIHPHKDSKPVSIYPLTSRMLRDGNGNEYPYYFSDNTPVKRSTEKAEASTYKKKNIEIGKRKIQSKENIENQKMKKKGSRRPAAAAAIGDSAHSRVDPLQSTGAQGFEEELKKLPAPEVAIRYYMNEDLYLFDEFQTDRIPHTRRPKIENLYDVFLNIRDDEAEHCKTMKACQTHGNLRSPHSVGPISHEDDSSGCAVPQTDCEGIVDCVKKSLTPRA